MKQVDKKALLDACYDYVEQRLGRIQAAIDDLQDALKLETKCSMGDKYETGRAMLHLEFEKLAGQMEENQKLKKTLSLINPEKSSQIVTFGTAVKTDKANYFIAIPAGELKLQKEKFYAVGSNAPVAKALMNRKKGKVINFNGSEILIEDLF